MVIRAQDILARGVIVDYLTRYKGMKNPDPQVIAELEAHNLAVRDWQAEHGAKLADR